MPRRSPEQLARPRAEHAERRLYELQAKFCPGLPDDILAHTSLRTLSLAMGRVGRRECHQTLPEPAPRTDEQGRDANLQTAAGAATTSSQTMA